MRSIESQHYKCLMVFNGLKHKAGIPHRVGLTPLLVHTDCAFDTGTLGVIETVGDRRTACTGIDACLGTLLSMTLTARAKWYSI